MTNKELLSIMGREGNARFWEDGDYKCVVHRHRIMGHLNGYVGLPKGHAWFGKGYEDIEVDVHGGLTYASEYMITNPEKDGRWWIGFDTAHLGDITIFLNDPDEIQAFCGETYKDMTYVISEVKNLLKQAKEKSNN